MEQIFANQNDSATLRLKKGKYQISLRSPFLSRLMRDKLR
jgi:hypothetical protein